MERLISKKEVDKQFNDILIHKKLVLEQGEKLVKHIYETDVDLSLNLLKRLYLHDNSKLGNEEFYGYAKYINTDNPKRQYFIDYHYKHNSHHPEHYNKIEMMSELDIMEWACDLSARSKQFNDDVFKFLENRNKEKWKMPEDIYNKLIEYLNIMNN